ncbi:MAG TPA: hypothetical protein VFS08_10475 [Gemmatimonadaceae bacterium]|nr:hypothetical protein [Gemmatimonadaceae bacterium]
MPSEPCGTPESAPAAAEPRLILSDYRFTRTPAGVCRAEVVLTAQGREPVRGCAEASASAAGELRVAAEAALRAIECSCNGVRLELLGVKCMRAFDAMLVIVAVAARRNDTPLRLLGCVQMHDTLDRAAVLAALDATNRVCALVPTQ